MIDQDFISFGPVHLEVRDPERTARFWQELAGFERRASDGGSIEVGTAEETLLVLHGGARVMVGASRSVLPRRRSLSCMAARE